MMKDAPPRPSSSPDLRTWGSVLANYLARIRNKLQYKQATDSAAESGSIMWDNALGYPVVSKSGVWRQILLADGHAIASSTTDITPVAANTGYAITWDSISLNDGITLGTPASRVVIAEGGTFLMAFSVQLTSTNASTKSVYFWPKINGVDVTGATMKCDMHTTSSTTVLSRTGMFTVADGDYIEAFYETTDTNITLESAPAGTAAPATPSVTLAITRIHG